MVCNTSADGTTACRVRYYDGTISTVDLGLVVVVSFDEYTSSADALLNDGIKDGNPESNTVSHAPTPAPQLGTRSRYAMTAGAGTGVRRVAPSKHASLTLEE